MAFLDKTGITTLATKLKDYFQLKLISGTNIKTVNGTDLLGSGDLITTVRDQYCLARVSANKSNNANVTSSPTLAITSQNKSAWTRADSNTSLVCPISGTYEVGGTIVWNPSSSGTWLVTFVMGIGGTDYTAYATSTGGTRVSATISPTIVYLSSGDKIDIRVTATGAGTIQSGVTLSRIAIRRIL